MLVQAKEVFLLLARAGVSASLKIGDFFVLFRVTVFRIRNILSVQKAILCFHYDLASFCDHVANADRLCYRLYDLIGCMMSRDGKET